MMKLKIITVAFFLHKKLIILVAIKGAGKIYQQSGINTFSNTGFTKVYLEKNQNVAADFIKSKVLTLFDEHGISILRALTENGKKYWGQTHSQHYQLFLNISGIRHSIPKVCDPRTNGAVEKLNQIVREEFYSVAFREKIYNSSEEIQNDLGKYMEKNNFERTNQEKRCLGITPYETFIEGIELYNNLVCETEEKEEANLQNVEVSQEQKNFLQ